MELILAQLGKPGRYHIIIGILFGITWWSVALSNTAMTFYGHTPNFHCVIEGTNYNSDHDHLNNSSSELDPVSRFKRSPGQESAQNGDNTRFTILADQCSYVTETKNVSVTKKCTSWRFEQEDKDINTIVTEWNLVCDKAYLVSLSSTAYYAGVFCGAIIFGYFADRFGRKKTLAVCLYCQLPVSLAIAFVPEYISFVVLRFILGIWLQGVSAIAYLQCIEFFQQHHRGLVMVGFGMFWSIGQMLMAFSAYIFSDWRHSQIAAALICLTTVPYLWWLPESPRWLVIKGRVDELLNVFIYRASKVNNMDFTELARFSKERLQAMSMEQKLTSPQDQTFMAILKSGAMMKRLLIMCYLWCVSSMAYYIFILNTGDLAGNRYINFTIGAALEIFVNVVIIFIMNRFGLRQPLIIFCFVTAALCLISGTVPKTVGGTDISWIITASALIGKMVMAAILCLIFVYAVEIFPTFARGRCLALCGSSLRIGGAVAPQVLFLKTITFVQFPYIVIAAAVAMGGTGVFLLPQTQGMQMPNTIDEAINMQPITDKSAQMKEDLAKEQLLAVTKA